MITVYIVLIGHPVKTFDYVNLLLKSLVDGKPICKAGKLIITNNQRFLVLFLLSTLILSSISWLSLIVWFFAQNGSLTLFRFGP